MTIPSEVIGLSMIFICNIFVLVIGLRCVIKDKLWRDWRSEYKWLFIACIGSTMVIGSLLLRNVVLK